MHAIFKFFTISLNLRQFETMNTKQFCSICLLLQTVFITPIASFPSSKSETPDIRQCVDIKDYDIYNWLIDDGNYGIIDFPKQEVDSLLMKDECGLTESGEVKKGNMKTECVIIGVIYVLSHPQNINLIFESTYSSMPDGRFK